MTGTLSRLYPWHEPRNREKIARLYREGLSTRVIRERFGYVPPSALREILEEHGVPPRGRGRRVV